MMCLFILLYLLCGTAVVYVMARLNGNYMDDVGVVIILIFWPVVAGGLALYSIYSGIAWVLRRCGIYVDENPSEF